jgi:hypothetical protein
MPDARGVPVSELIGPEGLAALGRHGRPPTPRELQDALPAGWVLADDGVHARRDLRLLFRRGWLLAIGMVLFGAAGIAFFVEVLPGGTRGVLRFAAMLFVLLLVGGVVGPIITRALTRRR